MFTVFKVRKMAKDQESKQLSTKPDPGYQKVNFDGFW